MYLFHRLQNCVLRCFSHVRLFVTPWTVASQAPLSVGSSRQEYWVGCHFFLQGVFLSQGSNPSLLCLLHCRWILNLLSHWGSPPKSQELLLAIHKHCQSLSENICLLVLDPGSCPPQSDLSQTAAFCSLGQFCIKMDTIRMIVVVMSLSNLRLFVFICLLLSLPPIHFCGRVHTQVAWCRSKLKCAFSRPHERQSVCLVILMWWLIAHDTQEMWWWRLITSDINKEHVLQLQNLQPIRYSCGDGEPPLEPLDDQIFFPRINPRK